jgi:dTDP-4-dehydrorhamnose reductase
MKRGGNHSRIVDLHMPWLITGGNGQLGIALAKELDYLGLDWKTFGSKDMDIRNSGVLKNIVSNLSPDVIVNCAAWTDVDSAESNELLAYSVNSEGAENVAKSAKLGHSKLLHISTDYVFSGQNHKPWLITDEVNPQSVYGRTKAVGEDRVLTAYPENSFIVRTAWLYSPWGKNFAKTMTKLAIKYVGEVRVVSDQFGQPTSAYDLARK